MDINDLVIGGIISALISAIIGTAVALFANQYFVEKSQKKIQHSKDFVDKTLRDIHVKIRNTCVRGCTYDTSLDRFIPKNLEPDNSMPHYESVKAHFKSGYDEEWKLWQKYKEDTRRYNEIYAQLSESLRSELFKQFGHFKKFEWFYQIGHSTPTEYLSTDTITSFLIKEYVRKARGWDSWLHTINKQKLSTGGKLLYYLSSSNSGNFIVGSYDDVNNCELFIRRVITDNSVLPKAVELGRIEDQLESTEREFVNRVQRIIGDIELGDMIKGNCSICSKF